MFVYIYVLHIRIYKSYMYICICMHMYMYTYKTSHCCPSTPATSLKTHPYVRYLTVSSCPWGSGSANHFCFLAHSLPFGKVTVFFFQIIGRTTFRKYWSATDKVCVWLPPFTRSLKRFFLCCTIESSDTVCGCFFAVMPHGTTARAVNPPHDRTCGHVR